MKNPATGEVAACGPYSYRPHEGVLPSAR